ncbi:hypothetical protein [Clostridium butyricum]|uniref:hypothetical protein n=1 Tax=Clostridium butyricum TaxID=1492 RepID=UPI001FA768EA|nr:hypothetical protein [Clostridium butyricum]
MICLNVTIIYDNLKDDNSYDHINFLLKNLKLNTPINCTEYFLPTDFSLHCKHYCQCIIGNCDYFNFCSVNKIAKSISDSDLIILVCSSLRKCFLPPSLKLLIEHLSYIWMPHKNHIPMSDKIGLVISNDYVPLLPSTGRTLKKHLKFWGIKNILKFTSHDSSKIIPNTNLLSKDYINLLTLSIKIMNIYSSNHTTSSHSGNIIKFPYSQLISNKKFLSNNNPTDNVIPLKKIKNDL